MAKALAPLVPRLELTRLAELGLLERPRGVERWTAEAAVRRAAPALWDTSEVDGAVVVCAFEGFTKLEQRILHGAEKDADGRAAAIFAAALSSTLAAATSTVHAAGGDVVHMSDAGLICVFPQSGDDGGRRARAVAKRQSVNLGPDPASESNPASAARGAVLRASKAAFTLVNQLGAATPELATTDGGSRAHLWPGLRKHSLGKRVLILEDLHLSRTALTRSLDKFGCMTHFAENASQAAAACANMEFDVILTNVVLPVLDGYEVARHIRAHGGPVNRKAYLVALTAVSHPELHGQCVAAGMNEVMAKPATMESLHGMFRRAARYRRELRNQSRLGGALDRRSSFGSDADGAPAGSAGNGSNKNSFASPEEVVVNPYSVMGTSGGKKPRPKRTLSRDGRSHSRGLALDPDGLAPLSELLAAGGTGAHRARVIQGDFPKFSDMLMASSAGAANRGQKTRSAAELTTDDGAVGASTDASRRGFMGGALARFFRAMCMGDFGDRDPSSVSLAALALETDGGDREDGDDRSLKSGGGLSLARYKASSKAAAAADAPAPSARRGSSDSTPFDTLDGKDEESDVSDDDEATVALPVTITATATVGFGRVCITRAGQSCAASINLRPEGSGSLKTYARTKSFGETPRGSATADGQGPQGPSGGGQSPSGGGSGAGSPRNVNDRSWEDEEARKALATTLRDAVYVVDPPSEDWRGDLFAATSAAAARGPSEGGPMQQVSAMSALVTLGDVALSPAAWRLVRDACDGDAPPSLRGAWRLNRIKVHEIVPPLSHHPLNRAVMTRLIPSSPDPVATVAALAPLVPHALRRQLMELGPASAAWLQARRQRREHSGGESGESGEESGAESDASESLADDDLARSSAGGAAVNPGPSARSSACGASAPGEAQDATATVVAHVQPERTRGGTVRTRRRTRYHRHLRCGQPPAHRRAVQAATPPSTRT